MYNVDYDNEPDIVYTYKLLEDYHDGDLKVRSVIIVHIIHVQLSLHCKMYLSKAN